MSKKSRRVKPNAPVAKAVAQPRVTRLWEWMRSISVAETLGLTPLAVASTALLMLLITRPDGVEPKLFLDLARLSTASAWALALALVTTLVLALPKVRRWLASVRVSERFSADGIKSYALALQLGMVLLVVPAFVFVWKMPSDDMEWFGYGFLNKRWLFTLYWLAVATFLIFPHAFGYLLKPRSAPALLPESLGAGAMQAPSTRSTPGLLTWFQRGSKLLLALSLAWFLAGPPWHLDRQHRPIDWHEQVHLGPLQAIDKGFLPYIGPGSTQYGPGSQLVTYLFMKAVGHFDIVGFREATALLHLVTMVGFCLIAFSLLDLWQAAAVLLLGLAYSPLLFFQWAPDGTLGGFYGWGNGCRYLGVLIVIAGLAWLAQPGRKRWMMTWPAWALGLLWGLFSWLAQENLSSTLMGAGLLMSLLWLSETATPRTLLRLGLNVSLGFVVFWAPILSYYAAHGAVGEFVRFYFLVPSMVVRGFSNTPWAPTETLQANAFYFTTPFLIIAALFTLGDPRTLRLRRPLNAAQVRLLGFLCALAASYPASLFRSDGSHLMNTFIALPFVIFLTFWDMPNWLAAAWPARWAWRIATVLVVFYLFPLSIFFHEIVARVSQPMAKFAEQKAPPARPIDYRPPFLRATRYLSDEPIVADSVGDIPMRSFLEYLDGLRSLIGTRRTYIQSFPGTAAAFPYFMMDLTPAPHLVDRDMLMINAEMRDEAVEYFREHVAECDALITPDLNSDEVAVFRAAYPNAVTIQRSLGTLTVYVLIGRAPESR